MIIGPSNGWLYLKKVYSMAEQEALFKEAGANFVEICFSSKWYSLENRKRAASLANSQCFNSQTFHHKSVHLPDITGRETDREFSTAQKAVLRANASFALTHPLKIEDEYPIKSYETMVQMGIPLAIENMDRRKSSGFYLKELEKLLDIVNYFVLDVQHAFEHDSTMKYAFDLFEMARTKLAYLHVSGETLERNHVLLFKAANCNTIIGFLAKVFSKIQVPIILEGEYSTSEELRQEITFLVKKLSGEEQNR